MENPQVGDLVRSGNGAVAWRVVNVGVVAVTLSSSESAMFRYELAANLSPY